ncbi:small-subunit processome [Zopfochytrium polystomum]|nr:small-subunit processome [Zopfochytrium polystomum]
MSSLRKAASITRRAHKERAQPSERKHLGLLEKKKDYRQRAANYKKKQRALDILKRKAAFRNPDEFYFGMINSRTRDGVHVGRPAAQRAKKEYTHDELKLFKIQDGGYVGYQRNVNRSKLEKMKAGLHFVEGHADDEDDDDDEGEGQYEDETGEGDDGGDGDKSDGDNGKSERRLPRGKHTVFVDTEEEAAEFDPAEYFDTPKELLHRRFNRPRKAMLESGDVPIPEPDTLQKAAVSRSRHYELLVSRQAREENLLQMQMELDKHKQLMGKGAKKKVGTDKNGRPIYKWKAERKR